MLSFHFVALLVSVFTQTAFAAYNLAQDYSGDTFFDGWDFFTDKDPTNGHVKYQSKADASQKSLIRVQEGNGFNNSKQVYIGVDSSSQAPNGRSSVRITSTKSFQHALVIADIAHQPGGICGVWPAFWMVGPQWPEMGEIDIVEGVSTQAVNQMTLHTGAGAVLDNQAKFKGKVLTSNCDVKAPNQPDNAGCGIADDSNLTFGTDFNTAGGGVYATEWTSKSIKVWFFPRSKIPSDVKAGKPKPGKQWGMPNSVFRGKFSIDDHFKDLQIVMNTAFCGDWAGNVWSDTPECAALAPTCEEYVSSQPKAFEQAFWLVNSIKVFQDDGRGATNSTATATSPQPATETTMVTVKHTITMKATVTANAPRPVNTSTSPLSQSGNPDDNIKPPGMMFGSPGFNNDKHQHKKRHGGAVLPSNDLTRRAHH